eukprot:s6797_g2.t1
MGPYEQVLQNLERLMQEEEEAYDYECFKGHSEQDRMVKALDYDDRMAVDEDGGEWSMALFYMCRALMAWANLLANRSAFFFFLAGMQSCAELSWPEGKVARQSPLPQAGSLDRVLVAIGYRWLLKETFYSSCDLFRYLLDSLDVRCL